MPDIILGCGARKRETPCPAWLLYRGPLFRAAYIWCRSVTPLRRIFILSAKHGLIPATTVIAPYDVEMRTPAQVCTVASLTAQARQLGLDRGRPVLVNAGPPYQAMLAQALPHYVLLLDHLHLPDPGTEGQMQWFAQHYGQLPRGLPTP